MNTNTINTQDDMTLVLIFFVTYMIFIISVWIYKERELNKKIKR